MTTQSTDSHEHPEGTRAPGPLNAASEVLGYLHGIKAAYTQWHQRSGNRHEQYLIELHAVELEHAIKLMEEVVEILQAEMKWEDHRATRRP